jgi:dihydroorotate dehydrogenase
MKESLIPLLSRLREKSDELNRSNNKTVPLVLKIAPDLNNEELTGVLDSVRETRIDGLICTNTTIDKSLVTGFKHGGEQGGLSGDPLRYKSPQILAAARASLGGNFPLIGSGGIMSVSDALNFRRSGANLVQLYTGFIYRGPGLIRDIAAGWQ